MTDPALTVQAVLTDEIRAWLTSELRYPVLAVVNERGVPVQSVMWFDLDPDESDAVLMNTKVGRAKDRQLRRRPQVSLCFEQGMRWVALQGRVELDDDRAAALEHIFALARRYGSDPRQYEGQQRVIIRLRVERVVRHD